MSQSIGVKLVIVAAILVFNVFFVIAEVAFLTATKAKIHSMIRRGVWGAKNAMSIVQKPDLFLSSVQIGLTLTELMLGWFGGISMSDYVACIFENIPFLHQYSSALGTVVSLALITYCAILVEVIPKRIAMVYPERALLYTSYLMQFYIALIYPFVWFLTKSIQHCLKTLRINADNEKTSVEEVLFVINQARHTGILHKIEGSMMKRVVTLSDMQVGAIMTPRSKIVMLDIQKKMEHNMRLVYNSSFTYFPVVNADLDNFIGVVSIKDMYTKTHLDVDILVNTAKRSKILYIPEVSKLTRLIELMDENKTKFAVVVDEYGGIEGLVTFTDVIQSFLGDNAHVFKKAVRNIAKHKDGSYVADGNVLIEEIKEVLCMDTLPGEDEEEYRTLASFLIKYLDNIPKVKDYVECESWKFIIEKMDKNRIEKVRIVNTTTQ